MSKEIFAMSIKAKLWLLAAITIFSLVFIGATGTVSLNHAIELEKAEVKIGHIAENMLNLRRHEKDFMMRQDLRYRDKFNQGYETIIQEIASVKKILSDKNF